MKQLCFLFTFLIAYCSFGQCPFAVQLISKGNNCLQNDTLAVTTSNTISQITWLHNNEADTVFSASTSIRPPQNATTIAGGNGSGSLLNQFNSPSSLFIDDNGNTYVADRSNYRILKFPPNSTSNTYGEIVAGGNGPGKANNQFQPNAIFVDKDGNLYVTDYNNNRVLKFPPNSTSATNGVVIAGGNGAGTNANQLANAVGLFVDNSGYLYVVDAFNDRIQKFPPNSNSTTNANTVAGGNGYGGNANQLNGPSSVFVDAAGTIYVDDAANNRIQEFPFNSTFSTNGITIAGGNGFGPAPNQLATPSSIWGDNEGNIYVADINNERIQKFPAGSTSFTFGKTVAGGNGQGNSADKFSGPNAVWGDNKGNLYVSDVGNNRIQKISTLDKKQYSIDTTFIPRRPGIFSAIVRDTLGCSVTTNELTINPSVTPAIDIAALPVNVIPCSQTKADISFTATPVNGGSSPIYQWQVNGVNAGTSNSHFMATLANHDIVSCLLVSNSDCAVPTTVESNQIIISFPSKPTVSLQNQGHFCASNDTLIVSANNPVFNISWYNGTILDTVMQAEEIAGETVIDTTYKPTVAGIYKAIVKDTYGCSDTSDIITILPTAKPNISIISDKTKVCKGSSIIFTATAENAGNTPSYKWQINRIATGINTSICRHVFSENNDAVRCIVYGDTTGCYDSDTSNTIVPEVKPLPVFEHTDDKSVTLGSSVVVSIPLTGDIINYTWYPVTGLSNPNIAKPVARPLVTTTYVLHVLSADSCTASDSIKIIVSSQFFIPTAFTPNRDGLNDKWYILGGNAGDKIKKLEIFNRQGQKVFYAIDVLTGLATNGWDGTYAGSLQPAGVYEYEAIIVDNNKTEKIYKGTITLIR